MIEARDREKWRAIVQDQSLALSSLKQRQMVNSSSSSSTAKCLNHPTEGACLITYSSSSRVGHIRLVLTTEAELKLNLVVIYLWVLGCKRIKRS